MTQKGFPYYVISHLYDGQLKKSTTPELKTQGREEAERQT